jgi:hypothetical protein
MNSINQTTQKKRIEGNQMNKPNLKNSFNPKSILLNLFINTKTQAFDLKEIPLTIKPKIYSLNNFNCKNQLKKEIPND